MEEPTANRNLPHRIKCIFNFYNVLYEYVLLSMLVLMNCFLLFHENGPQHHGQKHVCKCSKKDECRVSSKLDSRLLKVCLCVLLPEVLRYLVEYLCDSKCQSYTDVTEGHDLIHSVLFFDCFLRLFISFLQTLVNSIQLLADKY